jgi:CRISPR-associated endonuclease/helicase Cas3
MNPPIHNFTELFRTATAKPEQSPFPYQEKFATEGTACPEVVHAPTGAGKTATAILGWLWRRRFHQDIAVRKATPRRLVYCLPMRVLVEQTFGEAVRWLHALQLLDAAPDFTPTTADGVKSYQPYSGPGTDDKIAVHLLMGGEPRRDWDLLPERDAILIGTQDMLLSRALNRGYGMGRFRWPMHYGLLNTDCLWVFDEVQLMSTGLATSTQLQAFRSSQDFVKTSSAAKSVWMSATLLPGWLGSADFRDRVPALTPLRLDEKKDHTAAGLKERWEGEKPIQPANLTTDDKNMDPVAGFVTGKHQPDTLTLVIVNTVDRSRLLYAALRKRHGSGSKPKRTGKSANTSEPAAVVPEIKLIHSRFRPVERARWMDWLTEDPSKLPPGGRIVVSTQVVEAGVDLSARTLITELAPWPSLVQRFGRCNRRGEFGKKNGNPAQVFWLDVPTKKDSEEKEDKKQKTLAPPYSDGELNAARTHLRTVTDVGLKSLQDFFEKLTPEQREELFPYSPAHVIRRKDAVELFDTTPDLAGSDIDVSRFIRDGEDLDVQVFWRAEEPQAAWSKAERRRRAPRREELCPVPFIRFRDDFLGKGKVAYRLDPLDGRWKRAKGDAVYPGQVYWVPATQGGYDRDLGWSHTAPAVPLDLIVPLPQLAEAATTETGYDSDEWSEGVWQTVAEHTQDVVVELESIIGKLLLDADELEVLRVAARWHDWGKVHAVFQKAIRRPNEYVGRLLAKAPDGRWDNYDRPHFRHELASALAVLSMLARAEVVPPDWKSLLARGGLADLAVYLIAAHHGKVRLSIRSLPGEERPKVLGTLFARGVWDGDPLPKADLGGNGGESVKAPTMTLDLSPMQIGATEDGRPSWAERMLGVRDRFGSFRVAYLEAVLRAADMRASRKAAARSTGGDHA